MSTPRCLWIVQLDRARAYRSWRREVTDEAAAVGRASLLRAIGEGATSPVPIHPAFPGAMVSATVVGNAAMATVWQGEVPLGTFGVARRATVAPRLWTTLNDARPSQAERPAWPWMAWYGERSILAVPIGEIEWLTDYMRCAAWGWIEGAAND